MTEIPQEWVDKATDAMHGSARSRAEVARAVLAAVADDIRAQARREMAEEIAAAIEDYRPRSHDATGDALALAAGIAREVGDR